MTLKPSSTIAMLRRTQESDIADDRVRRPFDDQPDPESLVLWAGRGLHGQHIEQVVLRPGRGDRGADEPGRRQTVVEQGCGRGGGQWPQLEATGLHGVASACWLGLEGRVLGCPAVGVDGQDGTRGQQERHRHEAEDDRQPDVRPERVDDHAVERDPQRADTEGEREVGGIRGIADGRRRDVREERLELRALGEVEEAKEQDPEPQGSDVGAGQDDDAEGAGTARHRRRR